MKKLNYILLFLASIFGASTVNAQCPAGQTEITLEINVVSFAGEMGWELIDQTTNTVIACVSAGTYAVTGVVTEGPFCVTNGNTIVFTGYDSFGDDWNGGSVNVIITEDGSANGCGTQDGCVVVMDGGLNVDVEPDVSVTNSCETSNEEFVITLPSFDCVTDIVGCTDSGALNFNACANIDDASCIFPITNDACADAIPICGTELLNGSNIAATTVAGDPLASCIGSLENTVWFSFVADASGTPINLDITEGACQGITGLQTVIYSGDACGGAGVEEACNSVAVAGVYSLTLAAPVAGATYYLYIDGNGGAECAFTVQGSGGIATCCGPEVTATATCDVCDEDNFFVELNVTDIGSDASGYDVNSGQATISGTGIVTVGPFPNGSTTITITGITETDCVIEIPVDGDCTCPTTDAGDPAVDAGMDVAAADFDCDNGVTLTATLNTVIPGGFLGTYTIADNGAPCALPPDNPADCVNLNLGDDAGSGAIALPFPFEFFGVTYNDIFVGSNGYVTFTGVNETDLSEDPIPSTTDPNAIVALFWDDLDPGSGVDGSICTYAVTSGGQQCFVVDYNGVTHFPGGAGEESITGQVIICEDGTVTTTCVDCQSDGGTDTAVQGIENEDGTAGIGYNGTDGVTDGGDLMNCVTYTPDIQADEACDFVAWVTDPADIAGTTVSTEMSFTATPTETTTYFAIVDCEGLLCKDEVVVNVDCSACDPAIAAATAPGVVVDSESVCTDANAGGSGGMLSAPTDSCPVGSTLQYSSDGGTTWSTEVPEYDQNSPITVDTRCNCDLDMNVSSAVTSVTTMPGACPGCNADHGVLGIKPVAPNDND